MTDPQPGPKSTWGLVGVWLAASAVLTWRASLTWSSLVDDAYISARYAEQMAKGNGLVYNAGQPAVEGYTNLSWTVLLAAGRVAGLPLVPLMTDLGWIFTLVAIGASIALMRAITGRSDLRVAIPALLLSLSPHVAVTATNGLESSLFLAVTLTALAAHLGLEGARRAWIAPILGLLVLTRPEGIVVASAVCAHDAWICRRTPGRAAPTWIGALGTFLLLEVWRHHTYGAWLPNTWYAKTSFPIAETFTRNKSYLQPEQAILYTTLAAFGLGSITPPYSSKKALVIAITALLGLIPLTVQEWMPGLRLYLPWMTLTAVLLAAFLVWLPRAAGLAFGAALCVGMAAYDVAAGDRVRTYDLRNTVLPHNGTQRAMEALAPKLKAGSWMATRDAGVAAYYIGMHVNVAELHDRALTQPHPGGKDTDSLALTPVNPELFVSTLRTSDQAEFVYPNDRKVFKRLDAPYAYLGRVNQHYRRHYDVYVRADLGVTDLPEDVVVSHAGPLPLPARPGAEPEAAAPREPTEP